jgi:flagellar export protein FliJ
MATSFRLEFLLRLYAALERREELKLGVATRDLVAARQARAAHEAYCRGLREEMTAALGPGLKGAEMHFRTMAVAGAESQRAARQLAVEECQARQAAQREVLLTARRRRESLELLRRRRMEEERLLAGRREQATLDELFLMRRARRRD